LFAHGGIWIVLGVTAGGALATVQSVLRARRVGARAERTPLPERRLA
jgi:hypothetical protein